MDEQEACGKKKNPNKQQPSDKKEIYGIWKNGHGSWEEYRNVAKVCRDVTRKVKAHLELNLARDVKDNKKGFFSYIVAKGRAGKM